MQADNDDILVEHAFSSEVNLEIAIDIALAYEAIRHRIIGNAVRELKRQLRASSRGDELEIGTSFTEQPIPGSATFWARLKRWPSQYHVQFQSDPKDAKQLYMGVHHGDTPLVPFEVVKEHLAHVKSGKSTPQHGWSWWYWLEEPLLSWTTKEALLALHSGKTVDILKKDMLDIIVTLDRLLVSEQAV